MESDSYLNVLNSEQRQAVMHEGSPLLILAGAGSGKTRVITTKIAWLITEKNIHPHSILAVTFTKKAANEMKERAFRLTDKAQFAQIRTFHSFGSWFLRLYAEYAGLSRSFTVYDDTDTVTLLSRAVPEFTRVQCAQAAHRIARAKDYCLDPDSPDLDMVLDETDPDFADVYAKYQARLRETGNVDFGDLILLPVKILQSDEIIRREIQQRFKVIMVDEYQDSNVAQFELLKALAGPETYVCVVGDDDQSIYSFRGAEVKNILTFQESFAGSALIKLERNYRSLSPILSAADTVVRNNTERIGKTLKAERGTGKKPKLVFLANQDEETAFCAELIQQAHNKGCPYADWAVLYRTNAQSLGFETEFLNRKIPYQVVGSLKFYDREEIKDILSYLSILLNPRDEINFSRIVNKPSRGIGGVTQDKIIATARSLYEADLSSGNDEVLRTNLITTSEAMLPALAKKARAGLESFLCVVNSLSQELALDQEIPASADGSVEGLVNQAGFSTENLAGDALNGTAAAVTKPESTLASFIEKLAKISCLVEYYKAQDEIAGTQRISNIQELANSAVMYQKNRAGLTLFLEHIELDRAVSSSEEETDAVTLITLHNTKGLEFPRVIITGIEKGIFPREDKVDKDLEEERRLFYVGITRAKDELYLTSCGMRRLYGKLAYMEPSPFLLELNYDEIEILGKKPARFVQRKNVPGTEVSSRGMTDPLYERWKPGTKIYHDEFGYGVVAKAATMEGEFVITVAFETGMQKRFMPEYQAHQFMRIDD